MVAQSQTVMTALGFSRPVARLYEQVRRHDGRPFEAVADALLRAPEDLRRELGPLLDAHVVTLADGVLRVLAPDQVVVAVLRETASTAASAHQRLEDVVRAMPLLSPAPIRPVEQETADLVPLDGELSRGGDRVQLVAQLLMESHGELLWFRPDQWRSPDYDPMAEVLRGMIAEGRRSRAIYPMRAISEIPDTLTHRAGIGEEIRLVPDLPTRMLIIGTSHVILPEPLGFEDEPRSLVRQRGLVEAMILWFEAVWAHAEPLPSGEVAPEPGRLDLRRFVLQQLAAGAQDEQIARQLGVSLRTVRRRIADLMTELGAESRFQAGVEAARRGWL
ncbi:hypothetical protein GCM10022215_25330 [Nocardioides fonticola]|uniref:HTH luxR-type domain-containing protein n=1 Tax=Nocardioides fonticola TaxID=450363 RepID=A0ABP7XLJ0_9ACTN